MGRCGKMNWLKVLIACIVAVTIVAESQRPDAPQDATVQEDCDQDTLEEELTVEDLADALTVEDDDGSQVDDHHQQEQKEEQDNVAWEDITGNLTIVKPLNGSEVEAPAVAVQLNVHTNCPNTTRFQEKFNHSNVCMSLDDSELSCWPIFGLSKFPVFTNLSIGEHTLVARLVDPVTQETLIDESIAESTFFVIPRNETINLPQSDSSEDDDEDKGAESDGDEDGNTETISIPQVGIEFPAESMATVGTFEVRLHIVTAANLTQFRRLFQESFICLTLDDSLHKSCWPIFEETYYPKFFDLQPGEHTIVAYISHPNTLDIIPETSIEIRTFYVTEKDKGMIPMTLKEPSRGSNAFQPDLQKQVMEEIILEEDDEKEKDKPAKQAPEQGTQAASAPSDTNGAKIALQINVNGVRNVLEVSKDEDFTAVAARFCVKKNIIGQNCVATLTRLIEVEFQRLETIPHIELYTNEH